MIYLIRTPNDKSKVCAVISGLNLEGELKQVEITNYRKNRSGEQNKKWHAMVRDIAKELGYTPIEMKTIIKYALGYYHEIQGKSGILMVFVETSKMKVDELITLIDQTYFWASEKGIYLE